MAPHAADTPALPLALDLLPRIFLGEGNASISLGGLRHFGARTVAIVRETAAQPICDGPAASLGGDCLCDGHPCRQGTAAREAGKEAFAALVRENMWIPTLACVLYIIFVFHGPGMIRKPLPVPLPSSLVPARTPAVPTPALLLLGEAGPGLLELGARGLLRGRSLPLHECPRAQPPHTR